MSRPPPTNDAGPQRSSPTQDRSRRSPCSLFVFNTPPAVVPIQGIRRYASYRLGFGDLGWVNRWISLTRVTSALGWIALDDGAPSHGFPWELAAVLVLASFLSGCSLPITEPETLPSAIANQWNESVDVVEFEVGSPDTETLVVRIDPGGIHEFPRSEPCSGLGLVARSLQGEVARLNDKCSLGADSVWVLRSQGDYLTDYYGDSTIYRDE